MSRTYTLRVSVSINTLKTLVDGNYKLILGTEFRGIKTPLPDWEPEELPKIPAHFSDEDRINIEATWESDDIPPYKLSFAFGDDPFTEFNTLLEPDNRFVIRAKDVAPGAVYEIVPSDKGKYVLEVAPGKSAPTGAVGFNNNNKDNNREAQPILFKKVVTHNEGEVGWWAVSRPKSVWVPGQGTFTIPDILSAWFHVDDPDPTTEGVDAEGVDAEGVDAEGVGAEGVGAEGDDAEDSSNSVKLKIKYGFDKGISYDPEEEIEEFQWTDPIDIPQSDISLAPLSLELTPSSNKAGIKEVSKEPPVRLHNRKKKIARGAVNGAH